MGKEKEGKREMKTKIGVVFEGRVDMVRRLNMAQD